MNHTVRQDDLWRTICGAHRWHRDSPYLRLIHGSVHSKGLLGVHSESSVRNSL